jgi:hypothetical protein
MARCYNVEKDVGKCRFQFSLRTSNVNLEPELGKHTCRFKVRLFGQANLKTLSNYSIGGITTQPLEAVTVAAIQSARAILPRDNEAREGKGKSWMTNLECSILREAGPLACNLSFC